MSRPLRFLTLDQASEYLNVSRAQIYALVRNGEVRAIKIGGRGVWRIEQVELDAFVQRAYAEADALRKAWLESANDKGPNAPQKPSPQRKPTPPRAVPLHEPRKAPGQDEDRDDQIAPDIPA